MTPWLNCFTLAIFERLRLGRGRLVIRMAFIGSFRADDRVIGWFAEQQGMAAACARWIG